MKRFFVFPGKQFCLVAAIVAIYAISSVLASDTGSIVPLAVVPAEPGFPEGVIVHGNLVLVSGPARFDTAGTGPSAIRVFDRKSGEHKRTIFVSGEVLAYEHALSNIAVDAFGRIYALSTQLGLIRFVKQGQEYVQQSYGSPLPDLPTCAAATPGVPCSPTTSDSPPVGNDVVFDPQGQAYVTDSLQATIWRYAPGGGTPEIWFQSPLFEGGGPIPFGANGIRVDPSRAHIYFAISTSAANPNEGTICRLPLVNQPNANDLEVFHAYVGDFPDQLAFGARGNLYISLASSNQISVLAADGTEISRFGSAPDDEIPLDTPAGIAFDPASKSLMIANHALLSGNPDHFAVLKMFVDDPGTPLIKPVLP